MKKLLSALPLVVLLVPAVAHGQAYEDLMRQQQTMQARQAIVSGGATQTQSELASEADAAMHDRLQSLVSNGRCDDALRLAQSYKNATLIENVRQACGS